MVILDTFLRVMLAAQMRLGKDKSNNFPLESMLMEELTFTTFVLNSVNRLLLLMFRTAAVSMSMPSRLLRNVLVIKTYFAVEMTAGKVRLPRTGRETQEMLLTD